jgi:hypothetical protein
MSERGRTGKAMRRSFIGPFVWESSSRGRPLKLLRGACTRRGTGGLCTGTRPRAAPFRGACSAVPTATGRPRTTPFRGARSPAAAATGVGRRRSSCAAQAGSGVARLRVHSPRNAAAGAEAEGRERARSPTPRHLHEGARPAPPLWQHTERRR